MSSKPVWMVVLVPWLLAGCALPGLLEGGSGECPGSDAGDGGAPLVSFRAALGSERESRRFRFHALFRSPVDADAANAAPQGEVKVRLCDPVAPTHCTQRAVLPACLLDRVPEPRADTVLRVLAVWVDEGGEAARRPRVLRILDWHPVRQEWVRVPSSPLRKDTPPAPSEQVRRIQRTLNALGFRAGPTDGLYGARSRAAVRSFQRTHGLAVTGRLDRATVEAIQHAGERHMEQRRVRLSAPPVSAAADAPSAEQRSDSENTLSEAPPAKERVDTRNGRAERARDTVRVLADTELRAAPDPFSDAVSPLHRGMELEVLDRSGSWLKVRREGRTGYVHAEFVRSATDR